MLDTSTSSYIDRIKERLAEGSPEAVVYAALELRCAVEGRMKGFLAPLDHIPKAHKKEWSVVKLGKNINSAFQIGDRIASFTIVLEEPPEQITLEYIPISARLQTIANKLGDYLHFPGEGRSEEPDWIEGLLKLVCEGLSWLELSASGELVGVPLVNKTTNQVNLRAVIRHGDQRAERLRNLQKGVIHKIKVDYRPLPKVIPYQIPDQYKGAT